jgi:hypothetical protein
MAKVQHGKSSESEGAAWGRGQHSNMPKETVMKDYPKPSMRSDMLDDTMTGIDRTVSASVSKSKSHLSNQH